MAPIEDQYKLQASLPVNIEGDEADVSFDLVEADQISGGLVSGTVYDDAGTPAPINGATVKILSSTYEPLYHTNTNELGEFSFSNIPEDTYYLTASAEGFLAADLITITVSETSPVFEAITLTTDENQALGIIYGTVTEDGAGTPLSDVVVTLYEDDGLGGYTTISTTATIADGEFVIENIPPGTYQIVYSKTGYLTSGPTEVTAVAGSPLNASVALEADPLANTGTISGIVLDDETDDPIAGAFVGLYSVSGGAADALVAVTYTNDEGRYLFGGVADGQYIVKAKASVTT